MAEDYSKFMAKHGRGRCVNCGFLCKMGVDWLNVPERYGEIERATINNRREGNLLRLEYKKVLAQPQCYINEHNIGQEFLTASANSIDALEHMRAIQRVITKKRSCRRWTEWVQFETPHWHLDQARVLDLERMRREWATDSQEQMEAIQKQSDKQNRRMTWLTIVISLFTLASGIVIGLSQIFAPVILKAPVIVRFLDWIGLPRS